MTTSGMRLGKRLTLCFAVIIAFMASVAIVSSVRIARLTTEMGLIVNDRYPTTNIANRVKAQVNQISRGDQHRASYRTPMLTRAPMSTNELRFALLVLLAPQ